MSNVVYVDFVNKRKVSGPKYEIGDVVIDAVGEKTYIIEMAFIGNSWCYKLMNNYNIYTSEYNITKAS